VRLHRAFSWLERAETAAGDDDTRLVCLWIGFNALYCRWDPPRREPLPDRQCWREFLDRVLALDDDGRIGNGLVTNRDLVQSILDDEYLSTYFWQEPGEGRARRARKSGFEAADWYRDRKWSLLLERVVERVYLLRCQLVHGAATYGSKLNRSALDRCSRLLETVLHDVLLVVIDAGLGEDWGPMCYPPLGGRAT
jgi:hypothetical protein